MTDYSHLTVEQLHALKERVGAVAREHIEAAIAARTGPVAVATDTEPRPRPASSSLELEKDVEADAIAALEQLGFDVVKLSQYGRPKGMTEGIPDLYARHPKRRIRVWIEVKQPGGVVRPKQKSWHATERAAGGEVWVIWSIDDLYEYLRAKGFQGRLI